MSPPPDDVARSAVEGARSVLASWTVSAYLAHRRASSRHPHACAVSVDPGDALGDILRVLAKHSVLSAPVIERQGGRFHGFVDVAEILGAFVASCRRWLERPGSGYGQETRTGRAQNPTPRTPQNAAKETLNRGRACVPFARSANDEGDGGVAAEEALLAKLQGEMGANMFRRSLRAARQAHPELREGDGEAVYRGYLQASLLAVVSAAFLHPLPRVGEGVAGALASNHRIGVYDWDPAFDDGSRVADPSTFEIISQSDVVRFLHDRRDDERVRPLLRLSVRRLALLRDASRAEPRRTRPPGDDAAAAEAASEAASERTTRPLSSSARFGSSSERFGTRFGTHFGTLLPFRGVLCCSLGVSALDAFALMDAEGVSALGVCDDAYRLVANLSVSDLRGLRPETVDRLAMPVEAFLERQRVVAPEQEKEKEKEVSRGGGPGTNVKNISKTRTRPRLPPRGPAS